MAIVAADADQNTCASADQQVCANTDQPVCRICFASAEETCAPLVRPCACSGSMASVHSDCLVKWLNSKHGQPESPCCDICNQPLRVRKKGIRGLCDSNFDWIGLIAALAIFLHDFPNLSGLFPGRSTQIVNVTLTNVSFEVFMDDASNLTNTSATLLNGRDTPFALQFMGGFVIFLWVGIMLANFGNLAWRLFDCFSIKREQVVQVVDRENATKRNQHTQVCFDQIDEAMLLTVEFQPGRIGVVADHRGLVDEVFEGCQARSLGVKVGMTFERIDDKPFSLEKFKSYIAGNTAYTATLRSIHSKVE